MRRPCSRTRLASSLKPTSSIRFTRHSRLLKKGDVARARLLSPRGPARAAGGTTACPSSRAGARSSRPGRGRSRSRAGRAGRATPGSLTRRPRTGSGLFPTEVQNATQISTRGKSPGEPPDCRRVGRAKAAETLGPAITKRRMPTCMSGVLPHVHRSLLRLCFVAVLVDYAGLNRAVIGGTGPRTLGPESSRQTGLCHDIAGSFVLTLRIRPSARENPRRNILRQVCH
jgi:hypothetical protein